MDIEFKITRGDEVIKNITAKGIKNIVSDEGTVLIDQETIVADAIQSIAEDINGVYDIYEDDYIISFDFDKHYDINIKDVSID